MKTQSLLSSSDTFLGLGALCVVVGLLYIGVQSLTTDSNYAIFRQKNTIARKN